MNNHKLSFTNLWDENNEVHDHYGDPYTSRMVVLDKSGNQVIDKEKFNNSRALKIINSLD